MRGFKELQLLKGIIKNLNRLSVCKDEEFDPKKIDNIPTKKYLIEIEQVKERIELVGVKLQECIHKILLVQFSTLAFSSVSSIAFNLNKVEKKIGIIDRVKEERQKLMVKQQVIKCTPDTYIIV